MSHPVFLLALNCPPFLPERGEADEDCHHGDALAEALPPVEVGVLLHQRRHTRLVLPAQKAGMVIVGILVILYIHAL